MRQHIFCAAAVLLVLTAAPASAQRPAVYSTLQTTDTTANSILAGCVVGSTTCTGGIKGGALVIDTTSLVVDAVNHRVGVGTAAPQRELHVEGAAPGIRLSSTAGGGAWAAIAYADGNFALQREGSTYPTFSVTTAGEYRFWNGAGVLSKLSAGGGWVMQPGSSAAPALASTSDADSGLYFDNSTGYALIVRDGVESAAFLSTQGRPHVRVGGIASFAATGPGPLLQVGLNTNGSYAAGTLGLTSIAAASYYLWADATGVVRIHTSPPTANGSVADTAGTVLGTQTSTRASKNILGDFTSNAAALQTMLNTPLYEFTYKSGAYNGQRFVGITTDDSPEFGMDLGRSFNPVSAFGYTVAAVKALQAEVEDLRARVAAAEVRW